MTDNKQKALFHLPGLFEFYEFYKTFFPVYFKHRDYFYEWAEIASVYGAPVNCIWSGGRVEEADTSSDDVVALMNEYLISPRLTFSNSLLTNEHLTDSKCNRICDLFENKSKVQSGIVIHSDLLLNYLIKEYNNFYYVSSTTKVITDFSDFTDELDRDVFKYVVPDFRLNKCFDKLENLSDSQKVKTEFLCNECCSFACADRKKCYEYVSRLVLGEDCKPHICAFDEMKEGYVFSKAMNNPGFIGPEDITDKYMPIGFMNFKIEGRGLGSALLLEFILHYMVKPEYRLRIRELIYLDNMLDLF